MDNLLAGLRQHGLKAMRIGAAERVRPDLQDYTIEELASKHPLAADIEAAEGQLEDLWKRDQSGEFGLDGLWITDKKLMCRGTACH